MRIVAGVGSGDAEKRTGGVTSKTELSVLSLILGSANKVNSQI